MDATEKLLKKEFKDAKEKYLSEHRDEYLEGKRLTEWMGHNNMTPLKFLVQVLSYNKDGEGNLYKGSKMSMNKLFPMPVELLKYASPVRAEHGENKKQFEARVERCRKQYGADDWHKWNCHVYGVKWDVDATLVSKNSTEIVYRFDSAWCPPTTFIDNASEKFPNLYFSLEYEGEGAEFAGIYEAQNGGGTNQKTEPKTKYCEHCGNQLDEEGNCSECQ